MCEACASGLGRFIRANYSNIAPTMLRGAASQVASVAWRVDASDGGAGGAADTIFLGGPILTVDPTNSRAEALAVRQGRIVAVGGRDDVLQWRGTATEMVDLGGQTLMPGFVEPHLHLTLSSMATFAFVDVSPLTVASKDEVIACLKHAAQTQPAGAWIQGFGYDPSRLPPDYPTMTADDLDRASVAHPIFVLNQSGHIAYVNHRAMQVAGVTADSPNPPRGTYVKDANGQLTGELLEVPSYAAFVANVPRLTYEQFLDLARKQADRWAQVGCTTVCDCGIGQTLGAGDVKMLADLAADVTSPLRYRAALIPDGDLPHAVHLTPFHGDDRLRFNAIKFWADGSTQGFTAALREPYLNRQDTGTANYAGPDDLKAAMQPWHDEGWQIVVHSNGDRATDLTLEVYDQVLRATPREHRHRIDHGTVIAEDQLASAADLGLNISHTIGHVYYWGRTFRDHVLGPERARRIDPFASDLRHGLTVSMHSDSPVSPVSPLRYIQTAVTRSMRDAGEILGPEQCVSLDDAIRAVTINAAHQCFSDDVVGSLEVGKLADLVILEANPHEVGSIGIADIAVKGTYLTGKPVSGS